jgi:hypothetical protein
MARSLVSRLPLMQTEAMEVNMYGSSARASVPVRTLYARHAGHAIPPHGLAT